MKNLILSFTITALISFNVSGQKSSDVPENVKSAFADKFPTVTKAKWGMENQNEWEAEFKMDGKNYSANFNVNGVWQGTEYDNKLENVPQNVKLTIEKEFVGYKIKESEIYETPVLKAYEFELKKGDKKIEIIIDKEGKIVKNETIKNDEEND